MRIAIMQTVKGDMGFLHKGDIVDVEDTTARHYLQIGIGQKVDQEAEHRQTKIVRPELNKDDIAALIGTPERQKRKYQRRK